jgi:hypothetical protein
MRKWKMIFLDILGKTNDHRVNSALSKLAIVVGWSLVIPGILSFIAALTFDSELIRFNPAD